MIIRLPYCWPIVVTASLVHWKPRGTMHGPKSMPKLMAFTLCRINDRHDEFMWRLWVYFYGGYAWYTDVIVDRRE